MLSRSILIRRSISNGSSKTSIESIKQKMDTLKNQSKPYIQKMNKNLNNAKTKSVAGIWSLSNWINILINKTTGYDQITELEQEVTVKEHTFEETTKKLRELNSDYLNHQQRVMDLQVERSELMMKPKRTAEENKRLAELVANENEWEMPLEKVQKEYLDLFELQKKQLEEYKDGIYKRYYEERAWEQKIRRLGQYSYIAMLGLNLITFAYTRYDRKRIRENMKNTIDSSEQLQEEMKRMEGRQEENAIRTQELVEELKEQLIFIQEEKRKIEEEENERIQREEDDEKEKRQKEKEGLLQEAIQAIVSTQPIREKEEFPLEIPTQHERAKTNAVIVGLSTVATLAILQLLI